MPSSSRPRGAASDRGGRPANNIPMSERQQLAIIKQMSVKSDSGKDEPEHTQSQPRERNQKGETALHTASIKNEMDTVRKLLDAGENPNVTDFAGWTPLHEACNYGNYSIAQELIKAGANINARATGNTTPLHDAAVAGHLKLVKMLVEQGADPCAKNRMGKTPAEHGAAAVYDFLINAQIAAETKSREMKRNAERKVIEDSEASTSTGRGQSTSRAQPKEEEDVYEFKTTPKDSSSSGDDKSDCGKSSDKSSDEKSEELNKRKTGIRGIQQKGKLHAIAAKNASQTSKTVAAATLERKSPCVSPKPPIAAKADSDTDVEDKADSGPKVPPLKIVIPQQTSNPDQEMGTRIGKSTSARNTAALPYVVASSSSSNDSADKESTSSRCASPSETAKIIADDKKLAVALANEEQKQSRVLRSSNRGGTSIDRGSNNSSPQLQSVSPTPTPMSQPSTSAGPSSATPSTSAEADRAGKPAPGFDISETNYVDPLFLPIRSGMIPSHDAHPRKRKARAKVEEMKNLPTVQQAAEMAEISPDSIHVPRLPPMQENEEKFTFDACTTLAPNQYLMYLYIQKEIDKKLNIIRPFKAKMPNIPKRWLINEEGYVLASNTSAEAPTCVFPVDIDDRMKELFEKQNQERYQEKLWHRIDREKSILTYECEVLREYGRAQRLMNNQPEPFSVCTYIKNTEYFNLNAPDPENPEERSRYRYSARMLVNWLKDLDDKWSSIRTAMVNRHHHEADSLHGVQKLNWETEMQELQIFDHRARNNIPFHHVPRIVVNDDFDNWAEYD